MRRQLKATKPVAKKGLVARFNMTTSTHGNIGERWEMTDSLEKDDEQTLTVNGDNFFIVYRSL